MVKRTPRAPADPRRHAVPVEQLRRVVDPASLGFSTTADLKPVSNLLGQDRALAAIQFAASMPHRFFNLFVMGSPGLGKRTAVRDFLQPRAIQLQAPDDWVYVSNFTLPHRPSAIRLPCGRGRAFSQGMSGAIDELRVSLPALFESDDYQSRRRAIDERLLGSNEEAFETLSKKAEAQSIAVLRTPMGFAMAPIAGGKVIKPEVFNDLPEDERHEIQSKIEALQQELEAILRKLPQKEKQRRAEIRELNEHFAGRAIRQALSDVVKQFADIAGIPDYLKRVETDLIGNVELFLSKDGEDDTMIAPTIDSARDSRFRRYMVNVVVGDGDAERVGAPLLEEDNPTHGNLVGRIEHVSQMGALVTDFMLIKPGALHKANGGYLLLDARKVLLQPFAWEALKRALKSGEIVIESPAEQFSLVSTVSLEPARIPLNVKVVLFGDRMLYYLLSAFDPEFSSLFKVVADFDDTMDASPDVEPFYALLVAGIVERKGLRAVTAGGVARLLEEGSRMAEDSKKLTLGVEPLADLLSEADHWAQSAGHERIEVEDVAKAVDQAIYRQDRIRQHALETTLRDIKLVDTNGMQVGQINGLSVLSLGNFSFGAPSRITARARMGSGRLIDIEREVKLGGPLHSKGVMILRGFLEGKYAHEVPLSLSASLVFEQSYSGVEGDSASSAELYALLSALSQVPLNQAIAVTGSVNQLGQVQAIGGVNQKIEGFFDLCRARELTGEQGVLIPKANIAHLMLRHDVVKAVGDGIFHIHAVETIDQGIEILTGQIAGERLTSGRFPEGSVNRKVEDRLIALAESMRRFGGASQQRGAEEVKP